MTDKVNHPKHYTSHPSGIECIQITEHYNFCIGNAIKYLWRQGLKDEAGYDPVQKQIEDAQKAIWYINRHIIGLQKSIKQVQLVQPGTCTSGTLMNDEMLAIAMDNKHGYTTLDKPQKFWLDTND